ncbi:MAG: antitoxin [Candidatus Omnitrophota bacterium]|nr:antitoxin [Candidatus Omnitrophota bacterium]
MKLTKEEQDLVASVEAGEWKSVKNLLGEKRRYAMIARHTLRKDKRINIRISQRDLEGLQVKAVREGIPYQTLISSVLHKYVAGR